MQILDNFVCKNYSLFDSVFGKWSTVTGRVSLPVSNQLKFSIYCNFLCFLSVLLKGQVTNLNILVSFFVL